MFDTRSCQSGGSGCSTEVSHKLAQKHARVQHTMIKHDVYAFEYTHTHANGTG